MDQSVLSKIEQGILALPEAERRALISRISDQLDRKDEKAFERELAAMAADPAIQAENPEIENEFR